MGENIAYMLYVALHSTERSARVAKKPMRDEGGNDVVTKHMTIATTSLLKTFRARLYIYLMHFSWNGLASEKRNKRESRALEIIR